MALTFNDLREKTKEQLTRLEARINEIGHTATLIPGVPNTKKPREEGWRTLPAGHKDIDPGCTLLLTGEQSGVFVIDLDNAEAIQAFGNAFNPPDTLTVQPDPETYKGAHPEGCHLYFRAPWEAKTKGALKINGVRVKGVDSRGWGGYAVAPGFGGKHITRDLPIAEAPASWANTDLQRLATQAPSEDAYEGAPGWEERLPDASKWLSTAASIEGPDFFTVLIVLTASKYELPEDEVADLIQNVWLLRRREAGKDNSIYTEHDILRQIRRAGSGTIAQKEADNRARGPKVLGKLASPASGDVAKRESDNLAGGNRLSSTNADIPKPAAPIPPEDSPLIQFIDHDDLFTPEPAANLLVPGFGICPGAPTGLFGESYVGKTIMTMAGGMAVALGRPFWDMHPTKQGNWVHLDYEQGRRRSKTLIQRLAVGFSVPPEALRDKVKLSVFPAVNLKTANAVDHYAWAFDGCAIATLDALKNMTPGIDENSSEMRDWVHIITLASEKTGCVPWLLHNSGKSPQNGKRRRKEAGRGSFAIFDECQSVFVASSAKNEPTLVTHEKDRELGQEVEDFALRIEDVAVAGNPKAGLRVVKTMLGTTGVADSKQAKAVAKKTAREQEETRKNLERATRKMRDEEEHRTRDMADDDAARKLRASHPAHTADAALRPILRALLGSSSDRAKDALIRTRLVDDDAAKRARVVAVMSSLQGKVRVTKQSLRGLARVESGDLDILEVEGVLGRDSDGGYRLEAGRPVRPVDLSADLSNLNGSRSA